MKIVILDCHAVNPGDLSWEPIKEIADCVVYDRTKQDEVVERAKDADGILINKVARVDVSNLFSISSNAVSSKWHSIVWFI